MKKIKGPWYSLVWIVVWTAALIWFLASGSFDRRESVGLIIAWLVMVGVSGYYLVQYLRVSRRLQKQRPASKPAEPPRNALCPCGSGKKYKRCCGE